MLQKPPCNIPDKQIKHVVHILKQGGLIAYPTEAVFGLGCLPDKTKTIERLLKLKQRPKEKGLILIASELSQLEPYLCQIEPDILEKIQSSWPGPTTWILPTPSKTSTLIRGDFDSIAVRISAHPIVRELCSRCQSPIISTSANITGENMSYSAHEVQQHFDDKLDYILDGPLGDSKKPSIIKDAITGKVIRS
ncbi:MAG: L-threonylcarbamoyladenylate synthase [Gammaproteobacteria bacterium]|nr:L-threonylcarbamoyladenylate synthase [Gammaproteobacteria bacterium]